MSQVWHSDHRSLVNFATRRRPSLGVAQRQAQGLQDHKAEQDKGDLERGILLLNKRSHCRSYAVSIFQNLNSEPNEYRSCASPGGTNVAPKLSCDHSQLTQASGLIRIVYTKWLMIKVFRGELCSINNVNLR